VTDEPGQSTVSETTTEQSSGLGTEDFTAEGRQRAAEREGDTSTTPGRDSTSGDGTPDRQSADERSRDDWEVQLFSDSDREQLTDRWESVQQEFVDEPKLAVQDADTLVAETIQRIAETFSSARGALEERWSRGDDVSTEDLRITLQQYRSFFNPVARTLTSVPDERREYLAREHVRGRGAAVQREDDRGRRRRFYALRARALLEHTQLLLELEALRVADARTARAPDPFRLCGGDMDQGRRNRGADDHRGEPPLHVRERTRAVTPRPAP